VSSASTSLLTRLPRITLRSPLQIWHAPDFWILGGYGLTASEPRRPDYFRMADHLGAMLLIRSTTQKSGPRNYLPVRFFVITAALRLAMRLFEKMRIKERLPGSGSPVMR
jgi:hypothetical protein